MFSTSIQAGNILTLLVGSSLRTSNASVLRACTWKLCKCCVLFWKIHNNCATKRCREGAERVQRSSTSSKQLPGNSPRVPLTHVRAPTHSICTPEKIISLLCSSFSSRHLDTFEYLFCFSLPTTTARISNQHSVSIFCYFLCPGCDVLLFASAF